MVLIVDNFSSTAGITASMVRSLGFKTVVLPYNTDPAGVNIRDYSSVILTAGPGNMVAGSLGPGIVARQSGVPLLGVCQGMNMVARHYGGSVTKTGPVMCEDTLSHTGEGLFRGIDQRFRVVLRQAHEVDKKFLPQIFETEAYSSSGAVQSISISKEKVYAAGFDPSNYRTEHGLKILYNFLNIT